jgi:quinol monooxygenase YgiN
MYTLIRVNERPATTANRLPAAPPMIYVLAEANVKPGCLAQVLDCYRELVPAVLAQEPECIDYTPTIDLDLGLPNQALRAGTILVAERWRSAEAFRRHLSMAHSVAFRTKVAPLLSGGFTVRIVEPSLSNEGCDRCPSRSPPAPKPTT